MDIRDFLLNQGISPNIVVYITFALDDALAWLCYCIIALILGTLRNEWAFRLGIAFLISIGLRDFLYDCLGGVQWLLGLRLISLLGVLLAAATFALARTLRGGREPSGRKISALARVLWIIAVIGTIAVSVHGWRMIDVEHKMMNDEESE